MKRAVAATGLVLGLAGSSLAQTEPAVDPAVVARADKLLALHAEQSRGVQVLVATYVQRLVQDGLHGASVRTLGRAQLRSERRTSTIRIIFG